MYINNSKPENKIKNNTDEIEIIQKNWYKNESLYMRCLCQTVLQFSVHKLNLSVMYYKFVKFIL